VTLSPFLPLWLVFKLGGSPRNVRYRYGYGRFEDLAGIIVVIAVLMSAAIAPVAMGTVAAALRCEEDAIEVAPKGHHECGQCRNPSRPGQRSERRYIMPSSGKLRNQTRCFPVVDTAIGQPA
jgi:hypothetical protein